MKRRGTNLNNNYIVINSWMTQDLGLSGNELLVYAIIYGFSQANNQVCICGDEYFSAWLNTSPRSIIRIKKQLKERGLLEEKNNISFVDTDGYVKQDNRRVGYVAIRPQICDKMSCSLGEIGDKMARNLGEIGDKMACNSKVDDKMAHIIKKYPTKCQKIGDKMSRATNYNKNYNINNIYNNNTRARAREIDGVVYSLSDNSVDFENVLEANELWSKVLDLLEREINSLGFDVWIKPMKARGIIQNKLVLEVPTDGYKEEVERRYQTPILSAISKVCELQRDIPKAISAGESSVTVRMSSPLILKSKGC